MEEAMRTHLSKYAARRLLKALDHWANPYDDDFGEYPCPYCNKWLPDIRVLKKHKPGCHYAYLRRLAEAALKRKKKP